MVDRNDNRVTVDYSTGGEISHVVDTLGRILFFDYGLDGRIESLRLRVGNFEKTVVVYKYSSNGFLAGAATGDLSRSTEYAYTSGRLTATTNRLGGLKEFAYDNLGRCISVHVNREVSRTYAYDQPAGRTVLTDSEGFQTVYSFPDDGPVEVTDQLGNSSPTTFSTARMTATALPLESLKIIIKDPEAHTETELDATGRGKVYGADEHGRTVSVTNTGGGTWRFGYDEKGNLTSRTDPWDAVWKYTRDQHGYNTALTLPSGHTVSRELSLSGLEWSDSLGPLCAVAFDQEGFPTRWRLPDGRTWQLRYDANHYPLQLIYPDGSMSLATYDGEGNVTSFQDADGRARYYTNDSFGRCTEFRDESARTIGYEFDSEDRISAIRNQKGEENLYSYDPLGRLSQQVGFDGSELLFDYEARSKWPAITRSLGGLGLLAGRDAVGRLEKVRAISTDQELLTIDVDADGRVAAAVALGVGVSFLNDAAGRIAKESQIHSELNYRYSPDGHLATVRGNIELEIGFVRDGRGRLIKTTANGALVADFEYDDLGKVVRRNLLGGFEQIFEYDRCGRLRSAITVGPNQRELYSSSYGYSAGGMLLRSEQDGRSRTYSYDPRGRLLSVKSADGTVEEYGYDDCGNFEFSSLFGKLTIDKGNRLGVGRWGADYDVDGQQTAAFCDGTRWNIEFNPLGQIASVSNASEPASRWVYEYDFLSRRVTARSACEERKFVWAGDQVLAESRNAPGSATLYQSYVYNEMEFVPLIVYRDGIPYVIQTDLRGAPLVAWDMEGNEVWRLETTAFGDDILAAGSLPDLVPMRLIGQYRDPGQPFCYNRFRYYWPALARYLSHDPLSVWGGINVYAFPKDPYVLSDPFGLQPAVQVGYMDCRTVQPCPNQLPRDAAVAGGNCPAPLPFVNAAGNPRGGGGQRHNDCCQQTGQNAQASGMDDVRVNQRQAVGAPPSVFGGLNRPDVGWFNPNTKRNTYVEFDTAQSQRGQQHAQRLCNNNCDGEVSLMQFNPNDAGPC